MADENVVAVQVTAEVGPYVDAMKQAASATTASMDAVKAATANGAQGASAAIDALKAQLATLQASYTAQGKDVAALTDQLAELKEQLAGIRPPAEEGGNAVKGLGDKLREIGNEQRSERRFGAFIARDIQSIIPAAGEAGRAVAEMVSGIAFGSGIAVAIGAVKLLVAAFEGGHPAIKKFSEDSAEALKKVREQVEDMMAAMRGESTGQGFTRKTVGPLEAMRDQQAQAVQDAQKRVEAEDAIDTSLLAQGQSNDTNLRAAKEALETAKAELAITEGRLRATKVMGGEVSGMDALKQLEGITDAAAKEGAEREKIEREVGQKLLALHAATLDGNEKLEAEYVAKIAAIDQQAGTTEVQRAALRTAQLQAYRKQLSDFAAEQAKLEVERQKQADEDLLKSAEQITSDIRMQMQMRKRNEEEVLAETLRGLKKLEEEEKRTFQERISAAKEMASALGSAFASVVTGQESIAKAAAQMASAVIKSLMDIAIKTIETNALNAASGAAASQAGIPIIGPVLAVAAMASMEALVLGLLSSLPSAEGGLGTVPHDTLALVHADEQIMPADLARGQRVMQQAFADGSFGGNQAAQQVFADDGGGGGGDEIHVHFHVPAGAFLDQTTANRFIADPMVQKAISNAVRLGRWGNV